MLKIAIRADASLLIGKGHIMRCLTLARAITLEKPNTDITFITTPHVGNLDKTIIEQGFKLISLAESLTKSLKTPFKPIDINDTNTWLGRSQQEDANACLEQLKSPFDLIVVDHYTLDKTWHQLMRPICQQIMVIDDLANRVYDCDVLLDQTLSRDESDYYQRTPTTCLKLVGESYTLLREEFKTRRIEAINKRNKLNQLPTNFHVLITMGGFDPDNISQIAIDALKQFRSTSSKFSATVVLSSQSTHLSSIQSTINGNTWLSLELDCQNMSSQMLKADIAIGASGTTAWERCCLGLPTLSIQTADNQALVSSSLEKQGAVINLGSHKSIEAIEIKNALTTLISSNNDTYSAMITQCFISCDGNGAYRVYQQLFDTPVKLRSATINDLDLIFSWQSIPQVRQYFRNPDPITYSEHCQWFNKAITDINYHFYIIADNNSAVGMIRLDQKTNSELEISILISPDFQGKNLASKALTKIIKQYQDKIFYAYVDINNAASHKLFNKAKFTKVNDTTYRLFPSENMTRKQMS